MHLCFLFQGLKAMVQEIYTTAKEKAKENVQEAAAAHMWTSMNMEAYLCLTCHYITEEDTLNTILLGPTTDNLAQRIKSWKSGGSWGR